MINTPSKSRSESQAATHPDNAASIIALDNWATDGGPAGSTTRTRALPPLKFNYMESIVNTQQIFAIVLIIVGVAMFAFGLNATDSVADRFSNFFTGQFTDATMWYLIGGVACAVGGGMVWMFGGRGKRA